MLHRKIRLSCPIIFAPLVIIFLSVLLGCSTLGMGGTSDGDGIRLSEVAGATDDLKSMEWAVDREKYKEAVASPRALSSIRIVKIYSHDPIMGASVPSYRIFNIEEQSPYDLLGLQSGDVLLGVEGWVLFDPKKFPLYAKLLEFSNETSLQVSREGESMNLEIKFYPALDSTKIPENAE